MASDLQFWLAFSHIKKLKPKMFQRLLDAFENMEHAWKASLAELTKAGLPEKLAQELVIRRTSIEPERMIEQLVQHRVQAVTIQDDEYPELLKQIFDPPPLLYFKGKLQQDKLSLAVVGTRKMTHYGKQATQKIVRELLPSKFTIVSGLALGIDAVAHTTCTEHNARTIAVIGSGLDAQNLYPSQNRYVADAIIANQGCLFSEHPIGTPPLKQHFPQRNRVIAGIAQGTLVIEAARISGALITARFALEHNREVFALPGNIFSQTSAGCNTLLQQGAHVVTETKDITDVFGLTRDAETNSKPIENLPEKEQKVLDHLTHEPTHFNELMQKLDDSAQHVATLISKLELKGLITNIGGSQYIRQQ